MSEYLHERFGRHVLETEDPHIGLAAAVPVTLAAFSFALLPLAMFLLGALPFAVVLLAFLSFAIAAVPVCHAAAFGAPFRPLAITFSLTLGPCAGSQNQND
ncbi:MAG: hypothetical protein QGH60_20975 [Phycisphaerae bacterium]|nr:hypothetical protein [Phycisphaerae bacterium]